MKTTSLAVTMGLLLTSTLAFAGPPLALADAIRLEDEISVHMTEADTSFTNLAAAATQLSMLYVGLDAKATALRVLAARCATTCSAADRAAMGTAAADLAQTQANYQGTYLQLQCVLQNENRMYTSISNVMKTKHNTVKNSIGNIK